MRINHNVYVFHLRRIFVTLFARRLSRVRPFNVNLSPFHHTLRARNSPRWLKIYLHLKLFPSRRWQFSSLLRTRELVKTLHLSYFTLLYIFVSIVKKLQKALEGVKRERERNGSRVGELRGTKTQQQCAREWLSGIIMCMRDGNSTIRRKGWWLKVECFSYLKCNLPRKKRREERKAGKENGNRPWRSIVKYYIWVSVPVCWRTFTFFCNLLFLSDIWHFSKAHVICSLHLCSCGDERESRAAANSNIMGARSQKSE